MSFCVLMKANSMGFPCFITQHAKHTCSVHGPCLSLVCQSGKWIDFRSLFFDGQSSSSHVYGMFSFADQLFSILYVFWDDPTSHLPSVVTCWLISPSSSNPGTHPARGASSHDTSCQSQPCLPFLQISLRVLDVPLVVSSTSPVPPLVRGPPVRA